jgi:RimJ/RimL family protein N-acetyltransferase
VLKIKLAVVTGQEAAVKLYKSFGFRQIGIIEKELCVDGTYYDEYKMELLFE